MTSWATASSPVCASGSPSISCASKLAVAWPPHLRGTISRPRLFAYRRVPEAPDQALSLRSIRRSERTLSAVSRHRRRTVVPDRTRIGRLRDSTRSHRQQPEYSGSSGTPPSISTISTRFGGADFDECQSTNQRCCAPNGDIWPGHAGPAAAFDHLWQFIHQGWDTASAWTCHHFAEKEAL